MLRNIFQVAASKFNMVKDYVHSLGEPRKDTFLKIINAIEDGTLQGVHMAGSAARKLAQHTLPAAPQLSPIRLTSSP